MQSFNTLFAKFYILLCLFLVVSVATPVPAPASVVDVMAKRDVIPQSTFDNLVRYAKYSSGAYQPVCLRPLGNKLVKSFSSGATNTQGYVARDDNRKEIIVAFRGSQQIMDFFLDALIIMKSFISPGVSNTGNSFTHTGFLTAYNSVASQILSTVKSELNAHPGYTLISTGHSLGGALASLGGVSLKSNFPGSAVKLYTYGQPRTGNAAFASLVENVIGTSNIFRSVHTFDGVPTILSQALGYKHHGTEYWQYADPSGTGKVRKCNGSEDPSCSDSIPSTGINLAHPLYYGQVMSLDPFVCL